MERDRIADQEGMLYNQFNTANDFEVIEKYAKVTRLSFASYARSWFSRLQDLNVLLWSNAQKRCVIVAKAGHEEVKRFWKTQRPKSGND